jgi:hypothetical protein
MQQANKWVEDSKYKLSTTNKLLDPNIFKIINALGAKFETICCIKSKDLSLVEIDTERIFYKRENEKLCEIIKLSLPLKVVSSEN